MAILVMVFMDGSERVERVAQKRSIRSERLDASAGRLTAIFGYERLTPELSRAAKR